MNTVTKDLVPQTVHQAGDVVNGHVLVKSGNALTWVPLNAPVNAPRPVATVTTTSGTISGRPTLTRIILAVGFDTPSARSRSANARTAGTASSLSRLVPMRGTM